MTTSKIGPYCLRPTAGAAQLMDAGAKIVLLCDDFGSASTFARPGVTVIGRIKSDFTAESQRGQTPGYAANLFVNSQLAKYQANPTIKLWCGHNEPVWSNAADMAWYSQFEIVRITRMAELGLRAVIGNFSTGNPDLPLWTSFLPAVQAALQHNGILGLHEYTSPFMWSLTGKYQVDPTADAGDTGWTTLRYRKVIHDYLKPAQLESCPVVITECGLDRIGQVRYGMASGNWRTDAVWWNAANSAEGPISYTTDAEKFYADQLIWYDRELQKDPSVIGAVVFTVGSYGPPWADYDIDGTHVVGYLCDHIAASSKMVLPSSPPIYPLIPGTPYTPDGDPNYGATATPIPTETPMTTNLLINPTFGSEEYNDLPKGLSGLLPRGWGLAAYSKPGDPKLDKQDQDWGQPEILPVQWKVQFPEWWLVYGATGIWNPIIGAVPQLIPSGIDPFVLKVFKGSGPTMASFSQTIDAPAGIYGFTCPIFPDQWTADRVRPSPATSGDWYLASEMKASCGLDGTAWCDARWSPIGEYTPLFVTTRHPGGPLSVGFALRGRWGFANNGWFVDECSLVRVDDGPPPPPIENRTVLKLAQYALESAQQAAADAQAVVEALGG